MTSFAIPRVPIAKGDLHPWLRSAALRAGIRDHDHRGQQPRNSESPGHPVPRGLPSAAADEALYHPPMAIVGHGVDLVEVARIERLLREHPGRFASRCFTPTELTIAGGGPTRAERLAGRFAAKEAVLKALGTGLRDGIEWTQIEVAQADSGAPMLRLSGHAQRASEALGARAWWVSISHTAGFAVASAIAEGG